MFSVRKGVAKCPYHNVLVAQKIYIYLPSIILGMCVLRLHPRGSDSESAF
jgi:hypothetical protein